MYTVITTFWTPQTKNRDVWSLYWKQDVDMFKSLWEPSLVVTELLYHVTLFLTLIFFSLFGSRKKEVSWIVHQWWARPGSAVQRGQSPSVSTIHQQLRHWGGHQAKQRLRRDGFHGGEGKVLHLCRQSRLLTHLWHGQQSSDRWRWVAGRRWGSNKLCL